MSECYFIDAAGWCFSEIDVLEFYRQSLKLHGRSAIGLLFMSLPAMLCRGSHQIFICRAILYLKRRKEGACRLNRTKVLVIEDDGRLARLLELELEHAGYEPDCEHDGTAGLCAVRSWGPDLILLDRMLPGVDGAEICRRVRTFSDVPILMLTAKGEIADKVEGLDSGADDYITKPFHMEELLARIRAALRDRTAFARAGRLTVCNLTLDTAGRTVRRGNVEVHLTKREFDLLEYLMRNHGIVLTRGQILDNVWGEAYEGEANIVDVYVRYLRVKMDDAFEPKLLHTIRGVGYVLDQKESDS